MSNDLTTDVTTDTPETAATEPTPIADTMTTEQLADALVAGPSPADEDVDTVLAELMDEEQDGAGLEEVMGTKGDWAEGGRWTKCSEMGQPGALIRRLGPSAEMCIARTPNKAYTKLLDSLRRKWQARHNAPLPEEKVREALPALYAKTVLRGIRGIRLRRGEEPLVDTLQNRAMILKRYNPDLIDAVSAYAADIANYQEGGSAAAGSTPAGL